MYTRATARTLLALAAGLSILSLTLPGCGPSKAEKALAAEAAAPLLGSEAIDREVYDTLGYRLAWSGFASFDRIHGGKLKALYPLGDIVAVQDTLGSLTVLRTSSGELRWAASLGDPTDTYLGVLRQGPRLLAITAAAATSYDAENGTLLNRQNFARIAASGPAKLADVLVMGTVSRVAFGHLLRNGQAGWAFTMTGPSTIDPILASADSVAFPTDDGNVTIIDPGIGSLRGSTRMFSGPGSTGDAGDGAYYIPSLDQSLYAIDTQTAKQRWRLATDVKLTRPAFFAPGATGTPSIIIIQAPGRGLLGVDAATGKRLWLTPEITGDAVGIRDGRVLTFDPATGQAANVQLKDGYADATVTLSNVAKLKASPKVNGDIFAVSNRGEISKFIAR